MATESELVALDELEPWEKRPEEEQRDYLLFCIYRNMGPSRTYAATAREARVSASTISHLANTHDWNVRSDAWDFYMDRVFQAEMAERQRIMAREQMRVAQEALEVLQIPVQAMRQKVIDDPEALTGKDAGKLMKIAQDSIRLMPSIMEAERRSVSQPSQPGKNLESENINYGDAERIADVLSILKNIGVLDAFVNSTGVGEIIEAEVVEVDDDRPDTEANRLPPGRP